MNELDPILEAARLRYDTFTVLGRKFTVRQPSALQLIEHRQRQWETVETGEVDDEGVPKTRRKLRADATERGLAYLISVCVLDEHGSQPYTDEQGLMIVNGNPDVSMPFITAVTEVLGGEKKASARTSDSGTA